MTYRRQASNRTALLASLLVLVSVAACDLGYPSEDMHLENPAAGGSADGIVGRLNAMNRNSLTATRWIFALSSPCDLKMRAERPDGRRQSVTLSLLHSDVQVKGNVGGPVHAVQIDFSGSPALTDQHVFEADRWTDAVEYATRLQALQRICADPGSQPASL